MKQKIAVLGAGTMGHGIAASFAMGGHQVNLYSRSLESAGKGIRQIREDLDVMVRLDYLSEEEEEKAIGRITPCDDLKEAVSDRDYVIESLPENLKLKLAGPVRIVDYGGSDVWCVEAGNLLPDMDDSHEPDPLFRERLETGELGLKTGKGFYDFRGQDSAEIRAGFNEDMIRQLKLSKEFFMK